MQFFEDFNVDKESYIAVTNLLSNITTREGSHKGGWARLLKCQLINLGYKNVKILNNKDSLHLFDVIIFDLGAEYSGTLNMFGGLDEKVFKRLNELKNFKGSLFSWRNYLPSILTLSGRRANASSCEAFKQTGETFLQEVQSVLNKCQAFQHVYKTSKLLLGDSHTPSVWTPEFMIERRDGRTLEGMLERDTIQKHLYEFGHLEALHIHCGSIDVRHHICRHEKPDLRVSDLIDSLIQRCTSLVDLEVIFTHTMGIEDESRELPKTGYYKGTAFFGSWEQRNKVRQIFNSKIDLAPKMDRDFKVLKFPEYFFDESGKLKFEVLEKPQSVHISPEYYRTNLETGKLRW